MTSEKKTDSEGTMPLTEHLRELRHRIIICIVTLIIGMLVMLHFAPSVVNALTEIGKQYDYHFVYIAPQELLLVYLNVSLIGGLVIALPVIVYHIYAFCVPGLKNNERRFTKIALTAGTCCFVLGLLFARYITLPFMLRFLIQFTFEVDVSASISIEQYISFLLTVFVIFGMIFELPVVSVLLTALGIIQSEWLKKARKGMIVAIFLVAAIITPPDIMSQIMVAIPMIALYELSIFLSGLVDRRRKETTE